MHLALPRRDWLEQSSWLNYYYDLKNREKKETWMRTENKMNEISSTECAVEAHAVRLIICTNTFFCSRRIRYAYAVATIKWKIFLRTAIRFSVNAVVLINAIDLICMWIIPRFFYFISFSRYLNTKNTFKTTCIRAYIWITIRSRTSSSMSTWFRKQCKFRWTIYSARLILAWKIGLA